MTVIAGLQLGGTLGLLGDALITADGKSQLKLATPLSEDANPHMTARYAHAPALRQKVNILRKDVIVAWSGHYGRARDLFLEMSNLLEDGASPRHIVSVVEAWPRHPDPREKFTILALLRDEETTLYWNGATLEMASTTFQRAIGSGSGALALRNLIRRFDQSGARGSESDNDMLKLVMYSMALGAQAAGLELMTQLNFEDGWGGVVETAVFNRGEAAKVGEILYAFFEVERTTMDVTPLRTFVKQEYQGDVLVTHTMSADQVSRVIAIPPMLAEEGGRIEVKPPKLSYDWLCTCVLVREVGVPVDIFSTVARMPDHRPVRFSRTQSLLPPPGSNATFPHYSSSLSISVDRSYFEDIAGQAGHYILKTRGAGEASGAC